MFFSVFVHTSLFSCSAKRWYAEYILYQGHFEQHNRVYAWVLTLSAQYMSFTNSYILLKSTASYIFISRCSFGTNSSVLTNSNRFLSFLFFCNILSHFLLYHIMNKKTAFLLAFSTDLAAQINKFTCAAKCVYFPYLNALIILNINFISIGFCFM